MAAPAQHAYDKDAMVREALKEVQLNAETRRRGRAVLRVSPLSDYLLILGLMTPGQKILLQ